MKRDVSADRLHDPGILGRLDTMLAELRELRRLYVQSSGTDEDAALAELLREIQVWIGGDYCFSISELVAHAELPRATTLRGAIVAIIGDLNKGAGKRLGNLLSRNAGRTVNGLKIHRQGHDSRGTIWAVSRGG